MRLLKPALLVAAQLALVSLSQAKTIRASELTPEAMAQFAKGAEEVLVEFRQGDRLPLVLKAEGDLIATLDPLPTPTMLTVQRSFWLKMDSQKLLLSFDGHTFRPFQELVTGSLSVNATGSTPNTPAPADRIDAVFTAVLR